MDIQPNLCANAMRKAALLITKAADLGMNLSSCGEAGENSTNGNVYLWLEDHPFALFIDLSGGDRIQACWNGTMTDAEEMIDVEGMTLHALEAWADALSTKEMEEEEA